MEILSLDLKSYYKRVFPTDLFHRWLSYGSADSFQHREFSFTLAESVYVRYQSFEDARELLEELIKKHPHKIDIGAVYSRRPRGARGLSGDALAPRWKELVFDVDMTDYDDVRFCCQKADICHKCWPLMRVAMKVLQHSLIQDMGFRNILWVYSGRRGVHCWVSDATARHYNNSCRSAFINYFKLPRTQGSANSKSSSRVIVRREKHLRGNLQIHPANNAGLEIVRSAFHQYLIDQRILDTDAGIDKVLSLTSAEFSEARDTLEALWKRENTQESTTSQSVSLDRWKQLVELLDREQQYRNADEIMLEFMYPRLDENVSIGLNHLLKSPFSVHPSTGRICVPIDFDSVDEFDPQSVPTIDGVLKELKETGNIQMTSLGPYIDIFERFVNSIDKQ